VVGHLTEQLTNDFKLEGSNPAADSTKGNSGKKKVGLSMHSRVCIVARTLNR
jgi:hypothetical protein